MEKILSFDAETTGLPPKGANWEDDFKEFPHIVSLAWIFRGNEHYHIIRPDGWEIPEESAKIHGITQERAMAEGEDLSAVLIAFLGDCKDAELIAGHNIYFDSSIIKAEVKRLGEGLYEKWDVEQALWKGKRIDTMRPSIKWVDARTQDGRVKFPTLTELYNRCFPGTSFPAHNALEDAKAVLRCIPVLVDKGLIELKQKTYSEKAGNTPNLREKKKNERGFTGKKKAPKNADLQKTTIEDVVNSPTLADFIESLTKDELF